MISIMIVTIIMKIMIIKTRAEYVLIWLALNENKSNQNKIF